MTLEEVLHLHVLSCQMGIGWLVNETNVYQVCQHSLEVLELRSEQNR